MLNRSTMYRLLARARSRELLEHARAGCWISTYEVLRSLACNPPLLEKPCRKEFDLQDAKAVFRRLRRGKPVSGQLFARAQRLVIDEAKDDARWSCEDW